jgi:hypothetical protein
MTLRRALCLLCLAICPLALVGCASGDTLAFDPVANAADKTVDSTSARVAFSANISAEGMGAMSLNGTGVYDGRARRGSMDMTFTMPAAMQTPVGRNPRLQVIFDAGDGLVMYMRSSLFMTLPAGKSWVKMDLTKLAQKEGVDLSALTSANQADPSQALRMLMASGDSHVINYDRVRGVFTTHYALDIDLRRLAKQDENVGKALDKLMDTTGVDSFPAEAWIDKQGRIRKFQVTMSMGSQLGQELSMTMTEELYDFGVKVNIHRPPASQTADMSALLGS